jgi:hypothetical protein
VSAVRLGLAVALLALTAAPAVHAEPRAYRPVVAGPGSPGGSVDVPYTFGTHRFEVREVRGLVLVDWSETPVVTGKLAVPLAALRSGGDTLDCHLRESLGIDYHRSAFPGSHVCSDGKLPASGNDAVAYPEVTFEITGVVVNDGRPAGRSASGSASRFAAAAGQRIPAVILGRWTIHGVSHDDRVEANLTLTLDAAARPRTVRIEAARKLRLSDYGVVVKRALVITAGEEATVRLNLVLLASG